MANLILKEWTTELNGRPPHNIKQQYNITLLSIVVSLSYYVYNNDNHSVNIMIDMYRYHSYLSSSLIYIVIINLTRTRYTYNNMYLWDACIGIPAQI